MSNTPLYHGRLRRRPWPARKQVQAAAFGGDRGLGLPTELLEYVFILSQQPSLPAGHIGLQMACDDPLYPWPHARHAITRSRLGLVCKRWRAVLLGSPRSWREVEVHPGISPAHLRLVLERSGQLPLNISFFFAGSQRPWSHKHKLDLGVAEQSELVREAINVLANASGRWASVYFAAQESLMVDTLLEHLATQVAPAALAHVTIVYCGTHLYPRSPQTHHPFPPATYLMRTLQSVVLRGSRVRWRTVREQLAPNIVNMQLDYIYNHLKLDTFLRILAECQRLERFRVCGGFIQLPDEVLTGDEHDVRALVPALAQLTFADVQPELATILLQRVVAPRLISLSLDLEQFPVPSGAPDLFPFYKALAAGELLLRPDTIRSFTLRKLGIRLPIPLALTTSNFFRPFVAVTSLSLDFRSLQIEFWQWLLESVPQGHLSALTTLTVCGLSVVCIQELVCLREDAGLTRLHLVIVCDEGPFGFADDYHHPSSLLWLRHHTASCLVANVPE